MDCSQAAREREGPCAAERWVGRAVPARVKPVPASHRRRFSDSTLTAPKSSVCYRESHATNRVGYSSYHNPSPNPKVSVGKCQRPRNRSEARQEFRWFGVNGPETVAKLVKSFGWICCIVATLGDFCYGVQGAAFCPVLHISQSNRSGSLSAS